MMQILQSIPLAQYTTFGIGGPADFFVKATSKDAVIEAILYARANKLPVFILGAGANILIGDKGFRGMVIKNEAKNVSIHNTLLTAEGGALISDIILQTQKLGLSGLEHYAGIPSTVGGALWQNLHFLSADRTYTEYIGSIVKNAHIMTIHGEVKEVDADYFHFNYDWSILHETHEIVLDATFILKSDNPQEIQKRIDENLKWRGEKHPENAVKTSAGSIFKKLEGYGAGRLIQQVGMSGFKIGGAEVSKKHSNFIVNTGNATASDVKNLIEKIQQTIKEKLGLVLETEISFIGEF
ncbi:MAG TPA: UDP-N-acetylmuramate dehydrogenase [Patescibacteria group bacterium]